MKDDLLKELGVTFEVCGGADISKEAKLVIVEELEQYSDSEIRYALKKCRQECKGRMTLADIVQRMPRSRPSPDEAWAMLPFDERQSVVWTKEMAEAFGVCGHLYDSDPIGARMSFRETYSRLCDEAEARGDKPDWQYSAGTYEPGRESALRDAMEKGRLELRHIKKVLPNFGEPKPKMLPKPGDDGGGPVENVQEYIQKLKEEMGVKF